MKNYDKKIEGYKKIRELLLKKEKQNLALVNHYENLMYQKNKYYWEVFKYDLIYTAMFSVGSYVTRKVNNLEIKAAKRKSKGLKRS